MLKDDSVNGHTKIELINSFDKVFSLDLIKEVEEDEVLIKYIEECIEKRNNAKKDKNYSLADQIRQELLEKGIELMDTREGTKYKINK